MLKGFVDKQKIELAPIDSASPEVPLHDWPENIFAPELDQEPILEISEVQGSEGIFNGTVLDVNGVKYLFARKVLETAPEGQPDAGPLVMAELGPSRDIIFTKEIWHPEGKDDLIEDPRAYQTKDGTTIGVTVVRKAKGNKTYPGLIKIKSPEQLLTEPFPTPRIIEEFGGGDQTTPLGGIVEGKNATRIGIDEDENKIMYRPDGMNHTLQVLECTDADVSHVGFIDFPDNIPWALYKIGTTTPPEWLNKREAYIELHGINKTIDGNVVDKDTEDGMIYEYAIGAARLLRSVDETGKVSFSADNISRKAIITSDTFPELTGGRQIERHPKIRRAVYNEGAISTRNTAGELVRRELFPSQGDMRTWHTVVASDEIIANWDRTIPDKHP